MTAPRIPRFALLGSVSALLIVAGLTSHVPASGTTLCSSPPPVVAEKDLKPGTVGTAWTVIKGTKPVSFQVKVLGTMKGGIAPGIDFILIKVSGPVIKQTGGIAAGMSGSPVYVGGVLAGSVSYGFEGTDPTIGGMTPAVDMEKILAYPAPSSAPRPVTLGRGLRHAFARASASTPLASAPAVARPLAIPLVVPAALTRAAPARRLRRSFSHLGTAYVLQGGAGGASLSGASKMGPAPAPGDAMAAAMSLGDAYLYAIGTATITCDDQFVAFGHPFNLTGSTSLALTNARILQTLSDPSHFSGGQKFGVATTLAGTVNQDRLEGIAGITGVLPPLTTITSNIADPELGTSRHGETQVASASELPYIAYGHTYLNLLAVADQIGGGSANLDVTIQGSDEHGEPWTVHTSDLYASPFDIQDSAGYDAAAAPLDRLLNQGFEHVTVNTVSIQGTVSATDSSAQVAQVLSHTGLQPGFAARNTILARSGGLIHLRVMLRPAGSNTLVPVSLTVHVPNAGHGHALELFVGGAGDMGGGKVGSFAELVHALNHLPKHSEVAAELSGHGVSRTTLSAPTGHVVNGRRLLRVLIAP